MSDSGSASLPKLNRRQSIQLGTAGVAAGLLSSQVGLRPAEAKDPPPGPSTTPFVESVPVYAAKTPAGWTPNSLSPAPMQAPNLAGGECASGSVPSTGWQGRSISTVALRSSRNWWPQMAKLPMPS